MYKYKSNVHFPSLAAQYCQNCPCHKVWMTIEVYHQEAWHPQDQLLAETPWNPETHFDHCLEHWRLVVYFALFIEMISNVSQCWLYTWKPCPPSFYPFSYQGKMIQTEICDHFYFPMSRKYPIPINSTIWEIFLKTSQHLIKLSLIVPEF